MTDKTRSIADLLASAKLVAVLTIDRLDQAIPLARALIAGGVRTLEITLRTPAGAEAAAAVKSELPEAVVGLGTVLSYRDLELVKSLDLQFAFSPGSEPDLLDAAAELSVPFVPGVATASELMAVAKRGLTTVKLFPAEQLGGVDFIKALAGPFPQMTFNPTGGVTETSMRSYLALPSVVAVGSSWLAPKAEVETGNWKAITGRAERAMTMLT